VYRNQTFPAYEGTLHKPLGLDTSLRLPMEVREVPCRRVLVVDDSITTRTLELAPTHASWRYSGKTT
jgi:hypothetical protein